MKNGMITGLIVVVVAAGAGAFILTRNSDTDDSSEAKITNTTQKTENEAEKKPESSTEAGTISKLLTENKNRECSFTFDDEGQSVSGTSYFANGERMRMNYSSQSEGKTVKGSMIISKTTQTIWDDETKQGFTFAFDANEAAQQSQQGVDANQNINFTCKDWSVDETVFSVPGGVTVTNFEDLQIPTVPAQ